MAALASTTMVRLLDWDSAHFGFRIGRVTVASLTPETAEEVLAWAGRLSVDCMYLLAEAGDSATIRLASEAAWRMVDVRVTLAASLSSVAPSSALVRPATTSDLPYLKELAARSHRDSRFYADGNFPHKACDGLFAAWIERSVLDPHFAGAVFVPQLDGRQPAGYVTCRIRDGLGEIGLIAVDPAARGRGLGIGLLTEASRWFAAQGAERVSVVTQGCNLPALRMYHRQGFAVESVQLWFHWWRDARGAAC
jgi:dTDP-4-amino-4,6-dideoxy-D-galactose acyltransferase